MDAHALPLAGAERPALVPDRVRDPEPAEVVDEARPAQRTHLSLGQPQPRAGLVRRDRRPRSRGRGSTATSGRRRSRSPGAPRRSAPRRARPRAPARRRSPRPTSRSRRGRRGSSRPPRTRVPPARGRTARRARLRASAFAASTPPTRCATSTNSASCATRDAIGTSSPSSSPGQPRPSQLLVRPAQRREHVVGQPELLGQRTRHRGVLGDHVVQLAVAGERELQPDPEAVQRRVARRRASACSPPPCARSSSSWRYLTAFTAMSSPNHFACSCASE